MLQWGDSAARACIITAAFLVPLVFLPQTIDQFSLIKLSTLWVWGVAAIAFWAIWSIERQEWLPRARILVAATAFLAVAAISTAASDLRQVSIIGLYGRYAGLVPLALYVALTAVVIGVFSHRPKRLTALAYAAAAASPVMAAYVIVQTRSADFIHWGLDKADDARVAARLAVAPMGTMGNSNFAGAYLGITAPLLVFAILQTKRPVRRIALLVVAAFVGVALYATRSRGGVLAATAGLATVAVLSGPWKTVRRRVIVAVAVVMMLLGGVLVFGQRIGPLADRGFLRDETLVSRTRHWRAAADIMLEHPVVGSGPDTFYAHFPRHRSAEDGAQYGLDLQDEPHNILIAHASNLGLAGILSYLVLIGFVLVTGIRRIAQVRGVEQRLLIAFIAMFVAYLAQGMVSIDIPALAFTGWLALAAVAALADPRVVEARQRRAQAPGGTDKATTDTGAPTATIRRPWQLAIAVLAVPVAFVALPPVIADHEVKAAARAAIRAPLGTSARAHADRAVRLDRREAVYRAVAGDVAERAAQSTNDPADRRRFLREALGHFEDAARMRPGNVYYLINVARVRTSLAADGDRAETFAEADGAWRRVVTVDRTDWEVHALYARMLNTWANAENESPALFARAAQQMETVVAIRPDKADEWANLAAVQLAAGNRQRAREAAQRTLELSPTHSTAHNVLDAVGEH